MNQHKTIDFAVGPRVKGPLNGIRVLDLGIITAGAGCSSIFADFGATVVKVEAGRYPDPFRFWSMGSASGPLERSLDASAPFNAMNRNKLGICVDLKQEEGRATVLRLASQCDLVVENFRSGVLDRLGIGFAALQTVNPKIVLISISSQGDTGPERNYGSYGSTLDAISGIMSVTGYSPDEPRWSGADVNYPDQVGSILGAGVAMAAIIAARRTGRGKQLCLSQREMVTSFIGEHCIDYSVTGRLPVPMGNSSATMAPHGVFPCSDGGWIALAAADDAQWRCLAALLGEEARRPEYSRLEGRTGQPRLEELVAEWTRRHARGAAFRLLQEAGVTAFPVLEYGERVKDPHFSARNWFTAVTHPVTGDQLQRGTPFRIGDGEAQTPAHAPLLGQHTESVLAAWGFSAEEIARLAAGGVTSNVPAQR